MEVKIGGERLGSGNKMKAYLNNYNRSTHDLGYIWRSTMSAGTLVPFMTEFVNRGDSIDIELNCDIKTPPTVGALFGSFKVQLDVFAIPLRLYNSNIHMNALNIGRDMSKIYLPQITVYGNNLEQGKEYDNQQINPSSILSYLGIRGLGHWDGNGMIVNNTIFREFNATPYLAYWDIYKNYYANKMEEIGAVIHKNLNAALPNINNATAFNTSSTPGGGEAMPTNIAVPYICYFTSNTWFQFQIAGMTDSFDAYNDLYVHVEDNLGNNIYIKMGNVFNYITIDPTGQWIICNYMKDFGYFNDKKILTFFITNSTDTITSSPSIKTFELKNIDTMREDILKWFNPSPFKINNLLPSIEPYGLISQSNEIGGKTYHAIQFNQEGLAIKTYQSDLFNNWLNKDWIEGSVDSIAEITKIDTTGGSFTIDELNLSKKVFNLLTRIDMAGGSYADWLEAVYEEGERPIEEPIYIGGLSKELVFQEVVSNASTEEEPLGTIAARGAMSGKHKGGNIVYKVKEPMLLMGIVSITPRIDYSQGNRWFNDLKSWDDFHKPALDQIGFQNLPTDWMAFFDTAVGNTGNVTYKSAGKQPAWIHYTTNVNRTFGNFAENNSMMFMSLNRKYGSGIDITGFPCIDDLTTYIDPRKYNNSFADERLDAQNFWVQIACDITARRLMSASLIPNL